MERVSGWIRAEGTQVSTVVKNVLQRILLQNAKEMSVFKFFAFDSIFCSFEHYLNQFV